MARLLGSRLSAESRNTYQGVLERSFRLAPRSLVIEIVAPRPLHEELLRVRLPHLLEVFVVREYPFSYVLAALNATEDGLSSLVSKHLLLFLLHGVHDHRLNVLLRFGTVSELFEHI